MIWIKPYKNSTLLRHYCSYIGRNNSTIIQFRVIYKLNDIVQCGDIIRFIEYDY